MYTVYTTSWAYNCSITKIWTRLQSFSSLSFKKVFHKTGHKYKRASVVKRLPKLHYMVLFISKTFIGWNWQKIKQMLSNTLRLNFCYLKIIHILHPRYHPKIMGHRSKRTSVSVFIIPLIIMKMKIKMKNRSHRSNINRPKSRYGYKYSENKKCLSMMMFTCIKQHLSKI